MVLNKIQKKQIADDIKLNLPFGEILEKHKISKGQYMRLYNELNKPKTPEIKTELPQTTDEPDDLPPLIDPQIQPQQNNLIMDDNKDYCSGCYKKGVLTEIHKGQIMCLVCEGLLIWEQ